MAQFELEWAMYGRAVIEADDTDEAEDILHSGLMNLDSGMFEEVDVDSIETTSVEELEETDA